MAELGIARAEDTQDTPAQSAVQLLLFELDQSRDATPKDPSRTRTNTVGLYDLAPRFVFYPGSVPAAERTDGGRPSEKAIEREFVFRGRPFSLTLKPATIKRRHKTDRGDVEEWVSVYPCEREQVVEAVIRRLATERGRLSVDDRNRLLMHFSLYEVQKELQRVKRTLSRSEIKEALTILSQSIVEIRAKGKGGRVEFASSAFPTMVLRSQSAEDGPESGGDAETYLQFNVLVSDAIRTMRFRMMSYGWMMRFRHPVSRWLFNALTLEYEVRASGEPTIMRAKDIVRDSGMVEWSRPRDTLRAVRDAITALQAEGILESMDVEKVMDGRRLDDEIYTLVPSTRFLQEVDAAALGAERNSAEFERIAGKPPADAGFVRLKPVAAAAVRRSRRALSGHTGGDKNDG
ncbi:plasmid replication protein [Azospirillum sp. sgz302134]